jgi:hypothetical protein
MLLLKLRQPQWVYELADDFVESGYVKDYSESLFDGDKPVDKLTFLRFVEDLYNQSKDLDPRLTLNPTTTIGAARDRLYSFFHEDLTVVGHVDHDTIGLSLLDLYVITDGQMDLSELLTLVDGVYELDRAKSLDLGQQQPMTQNSYEEFSLDNPIYTMFERFTEAGVLRGYPEEFFASGRTLTAYEFAQAMARLLGSLPSGDDKRVALITAGVSAEELVRAYVFTHLQLSQLSQQIEGISGNLVQPE